MYDKPIIITKKKPQDENKKAKAADIDEVKIKFVSKEVGDMIKTTRNKQELSQKELAHKMNKNVNVVNTWENGKAVYDEKIAKKFEDVLSIRFNSK